MTSATDLNEGRRGDDGYHHGDLPNTLRRAAVEVIAERGVGGFSLREVARRSGVSHTAPAHHFGDMKGLLTSVAEEGFDHLCRITTTAIAGIDDPVERIHALGRAYVEMAKSHPSHFEVMFRTDIVDTDDHGLLECGTKSYGVLEDTVRSLIEAEGLDIDLDDAAWLCWSTMQGLVQLEPKLGQIRRRHGDDPVPTDELINRFVTIVVNGIRATGR